LQKENVVRNEWRKPISKYLHSKRIEIKQLVKELRKDFAYVSVLGVDTKATDFHVDKSTSNINPGQDVECGFVIKMNNGFEYYEYSLDDISGDMSVLAREITSSLALSEDLKRNAIDEVILSDEPLVKSFVRENDFDNYTEKELLDFCKNTCNLISEKSEYILNAMVYLGKMEVSKLFISENRELDQNYSWVSGSIAVVYNENEKTVYFGESAASPRISDVVTQLPEKIDQMMYKAHMLTLAKPIEPGIYDVITAPSITGLIAHEAFGHGVEMDQFVKDRALAKQYVGKYVASPICNMRDGAASTLSVASYFFDDDGVLAGDTQIIKDGILVTGLSDLASATQLGTAPTGNGRRQSSRRKSYARMTNTFFEKGSDKLEDMIASIEHGYMLFETNNGMEDPKNWAIQCVAEYGIEIVDGKLTDNWVSPVVMSGYVPDLLQSISMVSDDFQIFGLGFCGKGYKEWVRVSDGGPALKVRVKLG